MKPKKKVSEGQRGQAFVDDSLLPGGFPVRLTLPT